MLSVSPFPDGVPFVPCLQITHRVNGHDKKLVFGSANCRFSGRFFACPRLCVHPLLVATATRKAPTDEQTPLPS
jgi:hypothetical protein